jgi:hypothetical protein
MKKAPSKKRPKPKVPPTQYVRGATGEVKIQYSNADESGGCNFCPVNAGPIYVLHGRTMTVRLCSGCMQGLVEQTRKYDSTTRD